MKTLAIVWIFLVCSMRFAQNLSKCRCGNYRKTQINAKLKK